MNAPSTIAIDGPAASGKSSLGYLLAARLGYRYLDTGVMYRAVAWAAVTRGVEVDDEASITALAESLSIEILTPTVDDGRPCTILADGRDVTWDLRQRSVEQAVSPVSELPGVRRALTMQQRLIAASGRIVMVGRDIGTVVLPGADLKIYLDASLEVRARRRHLEMLARDPSASYEVALELVRRRDEIDSLRSEAPLKSADDAVVIDTTYQTLQQVLDFVLARIKGVRWPTEAGD